MLGFLHRVRLKIAPRHLMRLFPFDHTDYRRSARIARHPYQFAYRYGGARLRAYRRSVFGLVHVYNKLPEWVVRMQTVSSFQTALQGLLEEGARNGVYDWQHMYSSRLPLYNHLVLRLR